MASASVSSSAASASSAPSSNDTATIASSPPSLCANCDEAAALYRCADCPDDLTDTCAACCQQLHKPARTRRHRLRFLEAAAAAPAVAASADPDDFAPATEGHGFCDTCCASSVPANLAVLQCEGCGPDSGLCMSCDARVHAHLANDAHTRIFFSDDALPRDLQSASFVIAGFTGRSGEGIRLQFQDAMASYAGRIWPGSMMLARYLESLCSSQKQPDYFRGKAVIELGAGCAAIPSLTAWLLGARECLATDMNEDGLQILEGNFEAARNQVAQQHQQTMKDSNATENSSSSDNHKSMGLLSSRRLVFGDETPDLADRFDIVLGSYILYDPDSFVPLAFTLAQLLTSPRAVAYLTSHEPTRESALLEALAARGLSAEREPFSLQSALLSDETHADACADSASGSGRGSSNLGTGLRSTSILIVRRKAK